LLVVTGKCSILLGSIIYLTGAAVGDFKENIAGAKEIIKCYEWINPVLSMADTPTCTLYLLGLSARRQHQSTFLKTLRQQIPQ
jgi:hypothetical protein